MPLCYEQINSKNDLSTICRLCLANFEPNEMTPIFFESQDSLEIKITHAVQILVSYRDGLPATICKLCVEKLNAAYQFIIESSAVDTALRKVLMLFSETNSLDKNVQTVNDKTIAILKLINNNKKKINYICRLCAMENQSSELTKIFTDGDHSYKEKIRRRIYLKLVDGDGLPDSLCKACVEKLDAAGKFVSQSYLNDEVLRNVYYKRITIKKEIKREPELEMDNPFQDAPET